MPNDYLLLLRLSLPLDDVLDLVERLGEGGSRPPAVAIVDSSQHALVTPLLETGAAAAEAAKPQPTGREDAKRGRGSRTGTERALSERERQVLRGLAAGSTTRAIADNLMLAEPTVKTYIARALEKLEAATRLEAVAQAARRGLLD